VEEACSSVSGSELRAATAAQGQKVVRRRLPRSRNAEYARSLAEGCAVKNGSGIIDGQRQQLLFVAVAESRQRK